MNTTVPTGKFRECCGIKTVAIEGGIEPLCQDCEGCQVMFHALTATIHQCVGEQGRPFEFDSSECLHELCYDPERCELPGNWLSSVANDMMREAGEMAPVLHRLLKRYGI